MTKNDVNSLFEFLGYFFPNSNKLHDDRLKEAWLFVLRPYTKQDVADALAACLRESRFFPDPQNVAAKCPPLTQPEEVCTTESVSDAKQFELLERYRELKELRHQAGLPSGPEEAKTAGLSEKDWLDALERAGLGLETIL